MSDQQVEKFTRVGELAENALCPLQHAFTPGLYMRRIFMPAGNVVVGHMHKTEHFNMVLKGSVDVVIDGKVVHIEAPAVFTSPAGCRKVLHILEDTVWATTHVTSETDLDKLTLEMIDLDAVYTEEQRLIDCEKLKCLMLDPPKLPSLNE